MTSEGNNDPAYYRAWLALRGGGDLKVAADYLAGLRPELAAFATRLDEVMSDDDRRMLGGLSMFLQALEGAASGTGPYKAFLKRPGKRGPRPTATASAERAHLALEAFNRHLRKEGNEKGAEYAAELATGIGRSDLWEWRAIYRAALWGDLDPGRADGE